MTAVARTSHVTGALRQAAVIAVCLFVVGGLLEVLRPDAAEPRDILSSPFLWAALLWAVLLVVDAAAFEPSRLQELERQPLAIATAIAVVTLMVGLVSYDAGTGGRRLVYLAVNALGALAFWWALAGLLSMLVALVRGRSADTA